MQFNWLLPKADERQKYEYYRHSHIILSCVMILMFVAFWALDYGIVTMQADDVIRYALWAIVLLRIFLDPPGRSDHAFMEKRLRKQGSVEEMRRKNDSPATFITLGVALLGLSILARERLQLVGLIVLLFGGLMWYYYRLNRYEKKIIDMIEEEELEKKRIETISGGHHVDV